MSPQFDAIADVIIGAIRPSLAVIEDATSSGGTHWGGEPRLPAGRERPKADGVPLSLLFTVDCAEAANLLGPVWTFPDHGELLMFHADTYAHDSAVPLSIGEILHVDGTGPFREPPADLGAAGRYPVTTARLERRLSPPSPYDWDVVPGVDPMTYMDAVSTVRETIGHEWCDYLLGNAEVNPDGWRHLITLEAIPGVDWGELVAVSLWMRPDELAAGRMGPVRVVPEVA